MDLITIANISGITTGTIGTLLATYTAFKKSQMEAFFTDLLKLESKLSPILEDEDSKAYFYKILENATHEDQVSSEDFAIEVGSPPQLKWINLVISAVENHVLQGLVNDITERKILEESANQLAITDHLTGVANRLGFEKGLARIQFEMHAALITNFYLLMIDLDGFKPVNDQFGHEVGDKVLRYFSNLLGKVVRKSDFIARIGGDEFIVVLKDIEEVGKVQSIADKIITEASEIVRFGDAIQIQIGASIGIKLVDTPDFDLATVMHEADDAMYQAKKAGKNQYVLFKN